MMVLKPYKQVLLNILFGASAINEGVNQLYGIPQGAAAISSGMNTKGKSGFSMVEASSTLRKGLDQLNSVAKRYFSLNHITTV